jgi:FtsZ-binding cell division protein ZapB
MEPLLVQPETINQLIKSIKEIQVKIDELGDRKKQLSIEFVDIYEACRILKVSRRTMERYKTNQRIPYFKINKKTIFRLTDLEHFMYSESNQHDIILNS